MIKTQTWEGNSKKGVEDAVHGRQVAGLEGPHATNR